MRRKGVVLLITLMFISAISLLIIKNLDDSNQFIDEISTDSSLTQLKITNQNVQDEVIKLVTKYENDIDEVLEISSYSIPFNYGDVNLSIKLEEYFVKECYLNDIKTTQELYERCSTDITDNIQYSYEFIKLLNLYKPFQNQKQIDYFIKEYQQVTKDEQIELVKDQFEFMKIDASDKTDGANRYLKCSYDIGVGDIKARSEFVFMLHSKSIIFNSLEIY